MPVHDHCEPQIIRALEKAGWQIYPRQYALYLPGRRFPLIADIQAQKADATIIIVEVKCFTGEVLAELYTAFGQYLVYRSLLQLRRIQKTLYLAIPQLAYDTIFKDFGLQIAVENAIKLLIVDLEREE
ncbi:MAG: hypothetical protein MUE40_21560, partial [Anaerolineae bacterium]|nr:hypothetical protein [Anaerolineae bacterium]